MKTYRLKKCDKKPDLNLLSTKTDFPLQVFISYAHNQSPVVEDIMRGLENRGHKIWFDKTNITHGDDWRKEITDGVIKSNGVLSFISREAIREGGVCLDELGIAVGVKYGNIRTVLLEKEKDLQPIPAQLTHRQWLDMSDWQQKKAEGEESYKKWLEEKLTIIIQMIESDESREFVGDITQIRAKLGIVDTAISRQGWYLQQPFVGRKWLTEKLETWIKKPDGGHMCAVYGGPGTGKSAFAAQYAYRSPRVAASLFYEHGNTYFNSADAIVRELVFQLACRVEGYRRLLMQRLSSLPSDKALNTQELFEQMLAYPLQHVVNGGYETLCVLIDGLDECEADSQQVAARLLSEQHFPRWMRVVVLCRPENTVTAHLKPDLEIHMEDDPEANQADVREYFALRLEKLLKNRPDREALLDGLTERANGVFLYAYIVSDMILHDKLSLTDQKAYPENLNESFEKWFSRYFPSEEEFNRLFKLPLGIIAASEGPVPLEELDAIQGWYDSSLPGFRLTDPDGDVRMEGVVKRLERCALLLKYGQDDFGQPTVSFSHRYMSEWLTATKASTGQSASRVYFCDPVDAFWALERAWRKRLNQGKSLTDYQALHLLSAMQRAGEPEDVIRETARNEAWGKTLGEKWKQLDRAGKWKLCLLFSQEQLNRCQWAYGKEHPDTLTAMHELASTYSALGRYGDALAMREQVYAARKRILGEEHPATLRAMNNLAVTYSALGRHGEALAMREQVYAASKRILGEEHPDTLRAMNNLAWTYSHLGRHGEALAMREQVYAARKRILGEEHLDTLRAMNNLAWSYSDLGRHGDALAMFEQVYAARKIILGEEHPATLTAMNNLAWSYFNLGRYVDALGIFEQVYVTRVCILREEHPDTLKSLKAVSCAHYELGQYEKCIPLDEQGIRITEKLYGAHSKQMATALINLSMTYSKLERWAEALPLMERAWALRRELLGEDDPETVKARECIQQYKEKLR